MKRLATWIISAAALFVPFGVTAGEETDARANQFPLRFKDANGKVLGRVLGDVVEDYPFVVMQEGKHVFAMRMINSANDILFDVSSANVLYYESQDCSGTAYIYAGYMPRGMKVGDGMNVIHIGSGTRINMTPRSSKMADSSCEAGAYPNYPVEAVIDTIDITGKYQPPFTIR